MDLTSGGNGRGNEERFGIGSATIGYDVKAKSSTSPWVNGGITVRDSAQQTAATYLVKFPVRPEERRLGVSGDGRR